MIFAVEKAAMYDLVLWIPEKRGGGSKADEMTLIRQISNGSTVEEKSCYYENCFHDRRICRLNAENRFEITAYRPG